LGPVETDRAQQKTPLPFGAGLLRAILIFGSDRVQPRRSGAKKKHQTANKEAYYREKRARVRRDNSRGRNSSDTRIHRHRILLPRERKRTFVHCAMEKMHAARKNFASAAFYGATLK
jgi:hypothetical protein